MKHRFSFIAALCTLFAFGCTNLSNVLKLDHTNFTEEIVPDQNLSFTFASDLVPDSLTQKWDTLPYIKFTPEVKGKFRWNAPNELIFSPAEPFAPSTDFTAELTGNLLKHSPQKRGLPKDRIVKFHTPYLMLGNAQFFYALSQKNPGAVEIRANVVFNCKVKPADLKSKLHVLVNEKEVTFDVIGGDPDYSVGISMPDVRGESKDNIPVKIVVDAGFSCPGSTYLTKEKMEFTAEVPMKEKLMITQMTAAFVDGNGIVNVFTNQPVMNENLSTLISINPSLSVTAEKLDNGFVLKGNFEPDKSYSITIAKTLQGIFGYGLDEEYRQSVSFGELEPSIAFADGRGLYLSSRGSKNLAVNIASVNKVKVQVVRIYENNILSFMRAGERYGYYYEEADNSDEEYDYSSNYHDYRYYDFNNYGDVIFEKDYNVSSLPRQGNVRLLSLNLSDIGYGDKFKGLYLVTVKDNDRQWLQETKIVSLSDIGLIARHSADEVHVFANSVLTTEALPGVKVNFISTNNQAVATATTGKDGVATLKDAKATLGKFNLGMVTCSLGDDFNFMILGDSYVSTSRFDVGGKYMNDARLDCFIYSDRDIYRPGDSIHFNTIIRTEDWQVVRDVPFKVKLILPSGKEFQSLKKTPDAQGSFEVSLSVPSTAITGTYTFEVFTANDVYLGAKQISVEEFVPDRIRVATQLDKSSPKPGEKITATITANNLFGPPAANRKYEVELQLQRKDFYAGKFSSYNFNIQMAGDLPLLRTIRNGQTDNNGQATEVFELPSYTDVGIIAGNILTTVFDETGRPVHQNSSFEMKTQDVFYGIRYFDNWVDTRKPLTFQFISLNQSGQPISAQAQVEIYRFDWQTVIEQIGGRYRYNSQKKEILVSRQTLNLSASGGSISFTPYSSGQYEVRISRPGASTYVQQNFYAYGWYDTRNTSFEVSNEGEVEIQLDKERYQVGDKAEVLLKSPFEGKILLTVERGTLLEYHYLNTKDKAASITLPVKNEFLPNIFITATAIRKMSGNQLPLMVARGYAPLPVTKAETKIPVTITAAETSRSKTKQRIQVKTIPNAEVTIAVVDEGILQLKNTATPDPYNFFYAQRALQVTSYDLYPFLFPEYSTAYSSAALSGDMAEAMKNRVNPFSAKRFNLVALWSGVLKADGSGNATFNVDIPQFSGALRVMAVAYKDNTFGSAEKQMKVADPIVISTALPRFFSPDDVVTVPVTLANTTAKNADVKAVISVAGPLTISGSSTQSTSVRANAEGQVEFAVLANKGLGTGTVTITVSGLGEKFTEQIEIAVRPASTLIKQSGSGVMNDAQTQNVELKANMLPGSMSAKLVISKSPMTEFSKDLRYLIQYPYGCVEQTVSAAFPQLYYRDLAKAIGQENRATIYNPDYHVQQAIRKLESMQLYNGAIAYWPGGDYESWWGTTYAAHFLTEAKKAGFDVNPGILDKLYSYLQQKIKSYATEDWYYWDANGIARKEKVASREELYSMVVLATVGKFDQSAMNYYKAHPELLTPDSKYMLAAVFALAGNQNSYKQLLPEAWSNVRSQRAFGGSFYSELRDEALALYVLQEVDPDNVQIPVMSQHLSQKLRKNYWYSTQERAFSFLALGKIARKAAQSNVTATVTVGGRQVGSFTGADLTISSDLANQTATIQTKGTGTLYYFWEVSGIDVSGKIKEEDSYLKVRRQYLDRFGHSVNPADVKQNDLVVVKVSVQTLDYNASVENVAVTDLLPAGFEIENPRISSIRDLTWVKDAATYDYLDIRDDRISFFCTATAGEKNFYYVVRAVSKGNFKQGPVSADAMYNGEYHSYWGGGEVRVK
jgi:hypothetical protein